MELQALLPNPILQAQAWLRDAEAQSDMCYPKSMALATVNASGAPSVRIVLLKELTVEGFYFFTNYQGRKGKELGQNQSAALCFFWDKLHRQIRVEGTVEKLPQKESEAYFHSRPREAQLGAWASAQSEIIPSREYLETRVRDFAEKYPAEIPKPEHWGGYLLRPEKIEFWEERPNRLHDRFLYSKQAKNTWNIIRLSP